MPKLSREEVRKIANLIKINIKDADLQRFQDQLNTVIPSVAVLGELDTEKVKETAQTHGLENVLAEDVAEPGLDITKYPNKKYLKGRFFVVNRVIN